MTTNSTHAQACIPFPAPCSPPSPTHTTARSGYHRTQLSSTVYVSVRRACLHIDGLATRCAFRAPLSNAHAVASPDGPRPAQPAPHTYKNTHTRPRENVPCALVSTCRHAPKPSPPRPPSTPPPPLDYTHASPTLPPVQPHSVQGLEERLQSTQLHHRHVSLSTRGQEPRLRCHRMVHTS